MDPNINLKFLVILDFQVLLAEKYLKACRQSKYTNHGYAETDLVDQRSQLTGKTINFIEKSFKNPTRNKIGKGKRIFIAKRRRINQSVDTAIN